MNRREVIGLLSGAAAAWPLAARAQQKLPTIGLLGASTPANWSQWTTAFVQRVRELGWIEGRTDSRALVAWAVCRIPRTPYNTPRP
jgi:putative tryptophan/tyrosine transport system substrate-binding protein